MKELLKRWAELEPKRCVWGDDSYREWWSVLYDGTLAEVLMDDDANLPYIQAAVQEATTARRWGYKLTNVFEPDSGDAPAIVGGVDATVFISSKGEYADFWHSHSGKADQSAAEVLLAAYVEALEQQA